MIWGLVDVVHSLLPRGTCGQSDSWDPGRQMGVVTLSGRSSLHGDLPSKSAANLCSHSLFRPQAKVGDSLTALGTQSDQKLLECNFC